jgi:fimbrial chaperone protein
MAAGFYAPAPPATRIGWLAAGAVAVLLCMSTEARAFKLVPFKADFAPAGRGAQQLFRVVNDGPEPVAVQVRMTHRVMKVDGTEELPPADKDFVVYPQQLVVPAGGSRSVRVQYQGKAVLQKETAYRIIAEQLPVELDKEKAASNQAGLRVMVRYLGAIYVVPPGVLSSVAVEKAGHAKGKDGKPQLEILVRNSGNAHTLLKDLVVEVKGPGAGGKGEATVRMEGTKLAKMVGENVLAQTLRRFVLPWPEELAPGPVKVKLEFQQAR